MTSVRLWREMCHSGRLGVSLCNLSSAFDAGVCRVLSWSGGVCGGCFGSWWCRCGGGVGAAGLVERAVARHQSAAIA